MRVAVHQSSPVVGDIAGNLAAVLAAAATAHAAGAELLVTPELALCGYPPRDLLDRPAFVADCVAALRRLAEAAPLPILVGTVVDADPAAPPFTVGARIANAAALVHGGKLLACHRKRLLPFYDVFDEPRYFTPGQGAPTLFTLGGVRVAPHVCEDAWNDRAFFRAPRYDGDPVADAIAAGAELLVNLSASPYDRDKPADRHAMLAARCRASGTPLLYVNQVGGNDSLIFDGRSFALAGDGTPSFAAPAFVAADALLDWRDGALHGPHAAAPAGWEADVAQALRLGLRDYVRRCGFARVVLGLSGGIDSALTAALAVQALGPEHVLGVAMPSQFSSDHALADALDSARRLGIHCDTVPIAPIYAAFAGALAAPFAGRPADVTEENLQARIRGTLLMAYSNKLGAMLLSTGNKSEVAVGYCTLYGDMSGGLSLLSDVYKTEVYALARHLNAAAPAAPPIPARSIAKPPSAELRAEQTDQDSLPPYDVLDALLRGYVDRLASRAELVAAGHDAALVRRVADLVDHNEYKRRQMAPGLRISRRAFGEGRRLPIAQRYV